MIQVTIIPLSLRTWAVSFSRVNRSIAATRERQLQPETVSTVGVHVLFRGHDVPVERWLRSDCVVQTVESQSTLLQKELFTRCIQRPETERRVWEWTGEVTSIGVASDHLEAFREGLNALEERQIVPA